MKKLALLSVFLALPLFGQTATTTPTPAPTYSTFSLELAPVSLPGNKQTVAGTETGAALTLTTNFDVMTKEILAPGQNFQYFSGGFNYRLPFLSKKLNNISPSLNGLAFQFGLTASAGIDRITLASTAQHYAFTGGGFVNYSLGGGRYTLGAKVEYVKFPGLTNNNFTVALDPAIHF